MDAADVLYGKERTALSRGHPDRTVERTSVVEVEDLGSPDDPADHGQSRTIEMTDVTGDAPLSALRGHRVDDRVRIQMPKGPRLFKITRIG